MDAVDVDQQHGVTIHYPSTWQPATQFGHHPPALSQSDEVKPVKGFAFSEGGFPRRRTIGPYSGTNLEGFGVVYGTIPAANARQCDSEAAKFAESPKSAQKTIGGLMFSIRATGSAGMSQSISGKLYATHQGGTCYLFETGIAIVAPGVAANTIELTAAQRDRIEMGLSEVINSIRIKGGLPPANVSP